MMRRSGPIALTVAGIAGAGLLVACSGSPSTGPDSTTSGARATTFVTPKTGGEVTYVIATVNSRLDPAVQLLYSFSPAPVMNAIYGNLLYEDTGTTKIKMGFLSSFSTADGGATWTAVLRPGLKFSDGTPFDAEAIRYNITRDADPALGSPFAAVAKSLKLTTVSDTTLRIELPEPNLAFESIFMTDFGYVGSPTAEKSEGNANFGAKPVGAGPFKFQRAVAGQTLVLERNPYYSTYAPGQPYLDKITFQNIADYPHQSAALSSGQAQIAYATGQQGVAQLKSTPGIQFSAFQTGAGGDFIFNTQKAPFNDVRAREAITYALDRAPLGPATAAGTPAQQNMLTPQSPYYDKKFDLPGQDKQKAQQLFDELAAEGKAVDFHYVVYSTFPDAVNGANLLVAQLSKYKNVKITLDNLSTPEALSAIHTRNFQMGTDGLYIENPVPDITEYFRTGGSTNYSGFNDPKVDAAIADIQKTSDPAKLKADWDIIQSEVAQQYPIYPTNQGRVGLAVSDKLVNVEPISYGQVLLYGQLGYKK